MNAIRRLALAAVSLAFAFAGAAASAQDYPTRPVKIIVPQGPGSGADVVARMLADHLGRQLGQSFVVENRAGANGVIASTAVMREKPDGYTLLQTSVSLVSFNKYMYKDIPYDPIKDFTFIAPLADASFALVASEKSGIRTWDDFVKRAKGQPGELTFGSAGTGNSTHLYPEMIARRLGTSMRHIPYKGSSPALMAVLANEIDVMVVPTVVAAGQIAAGKVKPIAQSGERRSPKLPDVPLLKELNRDIPPLPGWYALVGPANMDAAVVRKLADAVNKFLADPAIQAKLADQYLQPIPGTPEGIQRRGEQESKLWGELIRDLKIEPS